MLNVKIVCVGTLRENYLRDAVKEYEKRLQAYCKLTTVELKDDTRLAEAVSGKSYKIALCVEGKMLSSPELATLVDNATVTGQGALTLVIGGADGPTAIMLAGTIGTGGTILGIGIGILLVLAGIWGLKKNKKQN